MTAGAGLAVVIAAFVAILGTVMAMAFRERRLGRTSATGSDAEHASDARVLTVIFVAIPGGMLLTLVTAWLVFF